METAFHNILSGKGEEGKSGGDGTGRMEVVLDTVSSQDAAGDPGCASWGRILLPWMGRRGQLPPSSCVFWEGAAPPLKYKLKELFIYLLPSFSLLAEIYRIVSQRQIAGQPESEFGPATSIEPIRVLPTQQEGRQAPCCQNI